MQNHDHDTSQKPINYTLLWERIEREAMLRFVTAMSRRDFLKALGAGAAVAALGPTLARDGARSAVKTAHRRQTAAAPTLPNGIAAGDVTQDSVVLWARSTAPGAVTFEIAVDDSFSAIDQTLTAEAVAPALPVKVEAAGLTPGTRYHYRVTTAAGESLAGRFNTPAAEGERRGLRFGVSGDWRGELRPYMPLPDRPPGVSRVPPHSRRGLRRHRRRPNGGSAQALSLPGTWRRRGRLHPRYPLLSRRELRAHQRCRRPQPLPRCPVPPSVLRAGAHPGRLGAVGRSQARPAGGAGGRHRLEVHPDPGADAEHGRLRRQRPLGGCGPGADRGAALH
ncbi:MAG: PhoD-like phosphatase N-terminal domain-containing protein [Chloroflexi bacterium]|nr:PhoD-like phosphatase N-terminal domain-containing protein [Chloroflexota bacterium]